MAERVKGGKVKAYYTTNPVGVDGKYFNVQKWSPDLEPDGPPYRVSIIDPERGIMVCSCPARKDECRHIIMLRKFMKEGVVGKHTYYDYDHDNFFVPASSLLEGFE